MISIQRGIALWVVYVVMKSDLVIILAMP